MSALTDNIMEITFSQRQSFMVTIDGLIIRIQPMKTDWTQFGDKKLLISATYMSKKYNNIFDFSRY